MTTLLDRLEQAASHEKVFELRNIIEMVRPGDKTRIEENIEYVLKRENLLPEGGSVVIPVGSWDWIIDEPGWWGFEALFEIFEKGGQNIAAYGKVTARGMVSGSPRMWRKRWGAGETSMVLLNSIDVVIN